MLLGYLGCRDNASKALELPAQRFSVLQGQQGEDFGEMGLRAPRDLTSSVKWKRPQKSAETSLLALSACTMACRSSSQRASSTLGEHCLGDSLDQHHPTYPTA